jgi:hypothetical protein
MGMDYRKQIFPRITIDMLTPMGSSWSLAFPKLIVQTPPIVLGESMRQYGDLQIHDRSSPQGLAFRDWLGRFMQHIADSVRSIASERFRDTPISGPRPTTRVADGCDTFDGGEEVELILACTGATLSREGSGMVVRPRVRVVNARATGRDVRSDFLDD